MRPRYRRYRRNLQLIGGSTPGKRWLLKDATHMFHLESFLEVFPDACVVTTMRDPVKMIPSVASLTASIMRGFVGDFDPHAHGGFQLELWFEGLRRLDAVTRALPAERVYRMEFDDFQADPLREVRRIQARFGWELSRESEAAMHAWLAANRKGRHGEHTYSLAEYGLSETMIREAFARVRRG
jgi:hypothetical protein